MIPFRLILTEHIYSVIKTNEWNQNRLAATSPSALNEHNYSRRRRRPKLTTKEEERNAEAKQKQWSSQSLASLTELETEEWNLSEDTNNNNKRVKTNAYLFFQKEIAVVGN